ncbi:transcription elongation factor GreB [Desulfuromonas thiophila]|uniref:Transcription elongation factor GreB n=1 Tax=Desulfuromonas thiophila TaxID=57664 RepID=A0A1G7ERZ8_9BACT|nr:transcription elongation factor GreB [Desulfuromonas thiophila]MDY0397728.1 transcription elongation factor GreB [Desulfuromonas thiophila]SDE66419.1 transcription elongation factor GreB [Desulfuromonas thiophila]
MTQQVSTALYMTPACAEALRAELQDLLYTQRPAMARTAQWAAGNGDRSENADYQYAKRALRRFDGRIRFLSKRLEQAQVIDPLQQAQRAQGRVLFGATVTVEEDGEERQFCIVGVDETDPARGLISYQAPLGRALLGKRVGDLVLVRTPGGERELEIIALEYGAIDSRPHPVAPAGAEAEDEVGAADAGTDTEVMAE